VSLVRLLLIKSHEVYSVSFNIVFSIYLSVSAGEFTFGFTSGVSEFTVNVYDKLGAIVYSTHEGTLVDANYALDISFLQYGVSVVKVKTDKMSCSGC